MDHKLQGFCEVGEALPMRHVYVCFKATDQFGNKGNVMPEDLG